MKPDYDLAIIGGGINGAGIARDAAGRGARVLLLEQGDLAQGTSSASTKLIHGGLRYLEHYEFALVREALSEREVLWSIAPHIIWPLRFVLPHRSGLRPRWLLRLGLFLYDHIGGRRALPATQTIDLTRNPEGQVLKPSYTKGFVYSDGWVDDARLVVLNARDAEMRGADIRTRCKVEGLRRDEGFWHIETSQGSFTAGAVVNAAGPAVLDLLGQAGQATQQQMRLVRGSHIVVPRLFDHEKAYFFQLADGRIFFAIPYEEDFTLIGTTDRDHTGPLSDVRASEEEIAYLCAGVNEYFQRQITPDDVVWTYSGVRPLVSDGSGRPEAATRGYRFEVDGGADGEGSDAPLLSVFGGKITTYRHLAASAVDRLAPLVPAITGAPWTHEAALPGGDFPKEGQQDLIAALRARRPDLPERTIRRLVRCHGTYVLAQDGPVGASAAQDGEDFGHSLCAREVDWMMREEWAVEAADILWRRTKLGLRFDGHQTARLEKYMAERRA
ncbi:MULTISPECIES: glycerol-3-phosphate dehydrogenase [unclassified Novosphingobium]|uniref:glycerol-3-phosphate dehydrogenase n=1 Tax=unclassified Novosphingobium TaxID=2644732 RepID=UPI00086D37AF|nr:MULTISPECIES: glycerol-3-phosphate dehydrogenase [unclassified Novosphingobium]MBN9144609.1 glycerol-3-phosphate dehydrogenase [Novosphingobium sp.]MDR6707941.1 glycerol-3-phosphate dehydrogenase [Novosphingobium sp. 1748]ODU78796.1 MAG: glycerol-3-phosphate dehydrogenase [Novosphingobium sp. SCN 63-17]OJX93699.1 MAG: glycerol-3-phosphate dehydrogenase [Novosphingobium sp. 63-713]